MDDPILNSLNSSQKEAVVNTNKHLLVIAGPGTGKTRVITHKIAYLITCLGIDPESILGITFTNRAATEMKERVARLLGPEIPSRPWLGTFHGFAHWLLARRWKEANLPKDFVIYDQDDQKALVRDILSNEDLTASRAGVYLDIIQRLKDDLMDAKSYQIHAQVSTNPYRVGIGRVYLAYQEALRSRGALDFGDLLLEANALLRAHEETRNNLQARFSYVFIDEYQDVNYAQYTLTRHLIGEQNSLVVVSDIDQSIYTWRNAQPRYTLDFDKDFKGTQTVILSENYRSTPQVLEAASKLIEKNEMRKPKPLRATRKSGPLPQIIATEDEKDEAKKVCEKIKGLLSEGVPPQEIALFYRTNAQSRHFEISFKNNAVPYRLLGALGFYSRRETKDILSFARILVNPKDEVSLWRVLTHYQRFSLTAEALKRLKEAYAHEFQDPWLTINAFAKGAGPVSKKASSKLERLLEVYGSLSHKLQSAASLAQILEDIAHETGYLEDLEEERCLNVWELVESGRDYERENKEKSSLLNFLNQTSLLASVNADNNRATNKETVSLMTTHLAKGLEFTAVFLTGLEEGLFPFKISKTNPEELEEERRLFYVGMTRAKDLLYLSYAKKRMLFGNMQDENQPSRFLYESGLILGEWRDKPRVRRGCRIKHPLFGEGRVITLQGSGESMKVMVRFEDGSTRKFLMKVAPLEVL